MKHCKWTGHSPDQCGAMVLPRVNYKGRLIIQVETKWVRIEDDRIERKRVIRANWPLMDGGKYCYYHTKLAAGLLTPVLQEERQFMKKTRIIDRAFNQMEG